MYKAFEIKTKKELKEFIEFPTKLYKGNPWYIPLFYIDEVNHLIARKNPGSEYCDFKLFAVRGKDGKMIGRTVAIINRNFNRDKNVKEIRFTRIDFIDDLNVSRALINAVIKWGKEEGMNHLIGPIGFNDLDKQGMLVEGFEEMDSFITFYNYPYYMEHMERLGLTKAADWLEFEVYPRQISYEYAEKVKRVADYTKDRFGYYLHYNIKRKDLMRLGMEMFDVYNRSFDKLYGFQPLTDAVKKFYIKQVITIINFDYCYMVHDKDDKIVGFGLAIPSMGESVRKYDGKIGLFSLFDYIKTLSSKNEAIDFYFICTEPSLMKTGISTLIFDEGIRQGIKNNLRVAYTGPQLENNHHVLNFWKKLPSRQNRRRRCYSLDITNIDELK